MGLTFRLVPFLIFYLHPNSAQWGVQFGQPQLPLEFWPNSLYWEILGSRGWASDWFRSWPLNTLQNWGSLNPLQIMAKRCQMEQTVVFLGVGKSWELSKLLSTFQLNSSSLPRCAHSSCNRPKISSSRIVFAGWQFVWHMTALSHNLWALRNINYEMVFVAISPCYLFWLCWSIVMIESGVI